METKIPENTLQQRTGMRINRPKNVLKHWAGIIEGTKKTHIVDEAAAKPTTVATMPEGTAAPTAALPGSLDKTTIAAPASMNAAQMETLQQGQFRDQQMSLAQQLAAQARGEGPSVAGEQLKQAQAANQAATFAQLASARGGANPGMARQAMQTSAQIQGQTARDAALARIQEQMGARDQLGQVLSTGRAGDIDISKTQAGLQQEANLTNYKGELDRAVAQGQLDQSTAITMYQAEAQKGLQDAQLASQFQALQQKYADSGMAAEQANRMASMELERMKMDAKTLPGTPGIAGTVGTVFSGIASMYSGGKGGK